MNVSLTPELEALVDKKVKSGRYTSASEVVREALRLLEERDRMRELRMKQLIEAGVAELDAGLAAPLDMKEVKARARKRKKSR
jgi:antitoxin ParD1/3/4